MLGAIVEEGGNFLGAVLGGLADGLSVHKSTHALASPVVKERVFLTALLNGFVFLGSHFLYGSVVGPAIAALVLEVTGHETGGAHGSMTHTIVTSVFPLLYSLFWLLPVWFISLVLSGVWYQDIAEESYKVYFGPPPGAPPPTAERILKHAADAGYSLLLAGAGLMAQGALPELLLMLAPIEDGFRVPAGEIAADAELAVRARRVFLFTIYVSLRIVTLFNGAWTVAWYAFDPLWTLRRWPLSRRLSHFESKWAYYAGFGMPAAIAGAAIPGLAGSGLWSLVFPVFVITAVYANPRGIMAKKEGTLEEPNFAVPERLPLLRFPRAVADVIVAYLVPVGKVVFLAARGIWRVAERVAGPAPAPSAGKAVKTH